MVNAFETEFEKLQRHMPTLSLEKKASLGSMLGAFIGDSIGALCGEFELGDCPDEILEKADRMPGGGPNALAPGQVTGGSELAMC